MPQDTTERRRELGLHLLIVGPLVELVCLSMDEHVSYAMTSPAALESRGGELRCGWETAPREVCGARQRPTCPKSRRGAPSSDPRAA